VADVAQRWRAALLAWAIPAEIEAAAERSPWGHPADRFAMRADTVLAAPSGASFERALEALASSPGSVLDVGAGVGAGGLPLLPYATSLTAVDPSAEMLAMLADRAARVSATPTRTVCGRWPEAAVEVGPHDVVVCHHVFYDVADLAPFVAALTRSARRRVVVELPPVHPMSWMAPLWLHFHGIVRPTTPTADDAVAVVRSSGVDEVVVDRWERPDPGHSVDIALITRRLCLPESAEPQVAAARAELPAPSGATVTLSWTGQAR
jgi:SAM-dependent methyltransferase